MKGFTLIELLVVVLIIGILVSIALPQYELVVEKSRATEAMINAKAIIDACQRHLQEFPDDSCTSQTKIADVKLNGGTWDNSFKNVFTTKNFEYDISNNSTVYVRRKNGNQYIYEVIYSYGDGSISVTTGPTGGGCNGTSGEYEQVCKLFTSI